MSVEAITWAFQQNPGGPGAKLLLVAIANHSGKAGVAFPGRRTLATDCATTPTTVTANMKRLVDGGLVGRFPRRRENGSKTSDWLVLAPGLADRGPMTDASADEYPAVVAAAACQPSADSSGQESGPDPGQETGVRSGQENTPGQVKKLGGPEPLEEPLGEEADASSSMSDVLSNRSASERNDDPEYVRLAELLAELVVANRDGRRPLKPAEVEKWRQPIRLMAELDGLSLERIEGAIRWSQRHHFWRTNILSADKLRHQYDRLEAQAQAERTSKRAAGNAAVLSRLEGRAAA